MGWISGTGMGAAKATEARVLRVVITAIFMFVSLFVDGIFELQLGMRWGYMGSNPEGWRCEAVRGGG